jgi:hypothetical protein
VGDGKVIMVAPITKTDCNGALRSWSRSMPRGIMLAAVIAALATSAVSLRPPFSLNLSP